jgi:succinyl-CoA synthetase alpha subunit
MSILVKEDTRILVQGITGDFGARHARLSLDYGSQVVAGVTPGKGGQVFEHAGKKVPIFNTVAEAAKQTGATVSAIFVPPPFAADAILECFDADLDLAVAITEGIPVRDMVRAKRAMAGRRTRSRDPGSRRQVLRRLPHRHRPGLHPPPRQCRRGLSLRHPDL